MHLCRYVRSAHHSSVAMSVAEVIHSVLWQSRDISVLSVLSCSRRAAPGVGCRNIICKGTHSGGSLYRRSTQHAKATTMTSSNPQDFGPKAKMSCFLLKFSKNRRSPND